MKYNNAQTFNFKIEKDEIRKEFLKTMKSDFMVSCTNL